MSTKQYKKRSEVKAKYKFDLEAILEGKKIEDLIKTWKSYQKSLIKVKDSKYESQEAFLKALKIEDKAMILYNRIANYISNSINADMTNNAILKLAQEFEIAANKLSQEMGPEAPRFFKNEKKLKTWIKDKKFDNYRKGIEDALETKKHQLPKAIQEYEVATARANVDTGSIFELITDSELNYGHATTSAGKKIKITRANRSKLMEHKDAKVRKTTAVNYAKAYLNHKKSLSNILSQHFTKAVVSAKVTKFDSVIDMLVYGDKGSDKLLQTIYTSVQDNLDVFKEWKNLHKRIYKKKFGKNLTKYDWSVPLLNVKTDYTIEQMQKEVGEALKPFGEEYSSVVSKAFNENWVDYMSIDNKRSGAYSIGGHYGVDKKYILMNNDGTIRSAETLAHELGHSLHSYFSDKENHVRLSSYQIFVAEIASIFNELMFFDYKLNNTDDKKLKFKIRQQMADGFAGTIHRQVMWSNYEYDLYKTIENGEDASSYEALAKIYYKNAGKYALSKQPKFKEEDQWASIMVPHYYYGFYVYKYAVGQLVANIFFQRYKENGPEALQDYIRNFLSVGGSMDPLETLKNAGVDLEDPETYKTGYRAAKQNNKELKKLAKELFKV